MSEQSTEVQEELQVVPDMAITAAVEEIIHNAGIEVRTIPFGPNPEDQMTLLRFHTPYKTYCIKLDSGGVAVVLNALGGGRQSDILIARPGDVPGLR